MKEKHRLLKMTVTEHGSTYIEPESYTIPVIPVCPECASEEVEAVADHTIVTGCVIEKTVRRVKCHCKSCNCSFMLDRVQKSSFCIVSFLSIMFFVLLFGGSFVSVYGDLHSSPRVTWIGLIMLVVGLLMIPVASLIDNKSKHND